MEKAKARILIVFLPENLLTLLIRDSQSVIFENNIETIGFFNGPYREFRDMLPIADGIFIRLEKTFTSRGSA
jgi:hypothetical protein